MTSSSCKEWYVHPLAIYPCRERKIETDDVQAFEGAGMEAWTGHTALVPTTEHPAKFGAWEDVDPTRPTLVKTNSEEGLTAEQQRFVSKEQAVDLQQVGTAL
jgi:hypothetical protein